MELSRESLQEKQKIAIKNVQICQKVVRNEILRPN